MISPTMHGNCSTQAEKRCGTKIWYYPVKVHQDVPWRTPVWRWRNYVALQWWGPSVSKKLMLQTESIRMLVKWYMRNRLKGKKNRSHTFMYRKQQKKKLVMTSVDKISPRWSYTNAGLKYFSLHIHSDISRTFLVKKSFDLFSN
jgi:hypothetical protein